MDSLKSLLDEFDPTALLPSLDALLGRIAPLVRLAVLIGPICLLVFGLIYLFLPPKEANHSLGFRCFWGMSSVDAWQFTQFVAGATWTALGLVMLIWMLISFRGVAEMEYIDLMFKAIRSIIWEAVWAVISVVGINVAVIVFFDFHGNRRTPVQNTKAKPKVKWPVKKS